MGREIRSVSGLPGSNTTQNHLAGRLEYTSSSQLIQSSFQKKFLIENMFFTTVVSAVLPPVHLLAYSALIGTELYQTFVVTKITYRTLPRPAFVGLQKQLFPAYFKAQSLLLLVVALTRPPYGPFSSFGELVSCIPFVIAGVTAGLNLVLYGPRTRALMIERATQGM